MRRLVADAFQQPSNGDISIQAFPVQPTRADSYLFPVVRCACKQTRKPYERNAQNPPVTQVQPHIVFVEAHSLGFC